MHWYSKLEKKLNRFAISNLMLYIVSLNAIVFIITYITGYNLYYKLSLIPSLILQGEVWRLFTYIFIPPDVGHPLFIGFALYLLYLIGSSLEHEWGTFKFNLFYFLGMIGTTVSAFISGSTASSIYISLSLFLAFAKLFPDFELLLFFIIPVKIKYLALLSWIVFIYTLLTLPLPMKLAAAFSIVNYFIFFGKDIIYNINNKQKVYKNRQKFKSKLPKNYTIHKCTVCGITEKEDPDMEFRYCSTCEGDYEYCMNHLKNHTHIKK